jgi:glutamate transport system substrate-binding protein
MICALALIATSACGPDPDPEESAGCTSALGERNITIAVFGDQPGWGFEEDYKRSGFDYDFGNWLGNELCFTPTFVSVPSNQREVYLQSGQAQLVLASFSKTDERMKVVSFAAPYIINQQGVLVLDSDTRTRRVSDLDGTTVCTAAGTTSLTQLEDARSIDITPVVMTGIGACEEELLAGRVDAITTDQLVLYGMANHDDRFAVVPDLVFGRNEERYGIGIPLGQTAWCETLTDAIRTFIIDGRWDSMFATNLPNVSDPAKYRPDPNLLEPCPPPSTEGTDS